MACTSYSALRRKEVINISDGARLGCISDLELEECTGAIHAIVVPGPSRFFGILKSRDELVIPYASIQKIGDDVILVEIAP